MKRQRHIAQGRHRITLPGQLYRENQTQNKFDWNKCTFIFVKLLEGWSYRGTFSDPLRVLCPCKIKHNLEFPELILVDIHFIDVRGGYVGDIIYLSSQDELMSFHLLTIFTCQDHISKVVVLCQVSKSSTLPLIFAKYFIWKIRGATQTHNLSLRWCGFEWRAPTMKANY